MKLQFYYPVGVAGPLARIIDGYVQEWNKSHPQIQVEPVFAGGYTEAYAKTLAAIQAGTRRTWRSCCRRTSTTSSDRTSSSRWTS